MQVRIHLCHYIESSHAESLQAPTIIIRQVEHWNHAKRTAPLPDHDLVIRHSRYIFVGVLSKWSFGATRNAQLLRPT